MLNTTLISILKKIWPYAILAIVILVFWPDIAGLAKEFIALIAGALGFLFWSSNRATKKAQPAIKAAKAEADEHENLSDIRLKEAIAELEKVDIIRDKIREQKITPMPDEPAPGKVRKVFKAR
jgi:flagellar biosynthesis component FlhA